jgi:hypothetical protein
MDQSTIPKQDIKFTICEASDCSASATIEVNIPVGDLGTINLLLCENCKSKFTDSNFGKYRLAHKELLRSQEASLR